MSIACQCPFRWKVEDAKWLISFQKYFAPQQVCHLLMTHGCILFNFFIKGEMT